MNGIGDNNAQIRVYTQNTPGIEPFVSGTHVRALDEGDIAGINQGCGNGWRKLFNIYAKIVFSLIESVSGKANTTSSWQNYRDQYLLQQGSGTCLHFVNDEQSVECLPYQTAKTPSDIAIQLVMGKHFALKQGFASQLQWLDPVFAVLPQSQVIVCPYFDYRQLTNQRIEQLVSLIRQRTQSCEFLARDVSDGYNATV